MKLPPFSDFLADLDPEKLNYDFDLYTSASIKEGIPFTPKQAAALTKVNIALTEALLAQYHAWLAEQLPSLHQPE